MFSRRAEGQKTFHTPSNKGIFTAIKSYLSRNKLGELLVATGRISPQDLKAALHYQKQNVLPLGQVLIELKMVSRRQLRMVLVRQHALRFATAVLLFMVSLNCGAIKKAKAETLKETAAVVSISAAFEKAAQFQDLETYPALFGSDEKQSSNLSAFTKWTGMFDKFEQTAQSEKSQNVLKAMRAEYITFKSDSIRSMADKVNQMMNRQKYILDQNNWGKSDYWETPVEFMQKGGDCEDFSIAKYYALRELGVPESRMRIAIVHDMKKNIPHAVLIVYSEDGPLVLDNQSKVVLQSTSISHYKPIFSINREAWWLHTVPETTIVASVH